MSGLGTFAFGGGAFGGDDTEIVLLSENLVWSNLMGDHTYIPLREQVTSRGGTTFAAISSLDESGVKAAFVKALHAARRRAEELGRPAG